VRKGNRPIEVRVDDETRERWTREADARGMKCAEMIRAAMEAYIRLGLGEIDSAGTITVVTPAPLKTPRPSTTDVRIAVPAGDLSGPVQPDWRARDKRTAG
jgi:hypothetical protein